MKAFIKQTQTLKGLLVGFMALWLTGCMKHANQDAQLYNDIAHYESLIQQQPDNPSWHASLGEKYWALYRKRENHADRKKAIHHLQQYLAQVPDSPTHRAQLYYAYYSIVAEGRYSSDKWQQKLYGQFDKLTHFNKLSSNPPSLAVYFAKERRLPVDSKIELLKKAIIEQPKSGTPQIYLYELYLEQGHENLARSVLNRAYELNPDNFLVAALLASNYLNKGHKAVCQNKQNAPTQKAAQIFGKMLKVQPENPKLRVRLGDAYRYMGRPRLALSQYQKNAQLVNSKEGDYDLWFTYVSLGKLDKSLEALSTQSKIDPKYLAQVAQTRFMQGNVEQALNQYQSFYRRNTSHFYDALMYAYLQRIRQPNKEPKFNYWGELSPGEQKLK